MTSIQLDIGDQYDKQCGEMFLTLKGNIVFHCTLCENKYERFETYADHILALHYMSGELLNIKQEIVEQLNEENEELPPVKRKKRPQISELMMNLFEDDDSISKQNEKVIKQEVGETVQPSISGTVQNRNANQEEDNANYLETFEIKIETDSDTNTENEFLVSADQENEETEANSNSEKSETNDGLFKCLECGVAFTVYKNLEYHLRKHYSNEETKTQNEDQNNSQQSYVCTVCGKGFTTPVDLQTHMEFYINEKNKVCTTCEMCFESNHSMHRHFAVHINERNFKCDVCHASFKKQKGLYFHQMIHVEKTLFSCVLCGAQFTLRTGLKWHLRTNHSKKTDSHNSEIDEPYLNVDSDVMVSAALI